MASDKVAFGESPWQQGFTHGRNGGDLPPAPAHWSDRARTMYENGYREAREREQPPTDWNAPIAGQPAAIVTAPAGAYLARFPAQVAGGMENAKAAAEAWRKDNAPGATVREFTGESMLLWNDAQGFADLFRALLAAGLDRGAARKIMAERDQEAYAGHIAQARENYASDDIEIDDAPEISAGGDPGVWVAAWVWVRDDEVTDYDSDDVCPGCGCPMGEDHADDCEESEEQEA